MTFKEKVGHLIEAGFQMLYVATTERGRCEEELTTLARDLSMQLVTWDGVEGMSGGGDMKDPLEALMSLDPDNSDARKKPDALFVFRNLDVFFEEPAIRQVIQNLYYGQKLSNNDVKHPLIVLSAGVSIHPALQPCFTVAEFSLPSEGEIRAVFEAVTESIEVDSTRPGAVTECDAELAARAGQRPESPGPIGHHQNQRRSDCGNNREAGRRRPGPRPQALRAFWQS